MALPEWAYFMQKVYADRSLGVDPKAEFQRPAELNNNPIYADQNFAAIVQEGKGGDSADVRGNGNATDYGVPSDVPVESDFSQEQPKEKTPVPETKKPLGPAFYNPKKDTGNSNKNKTPKAVLKPKNNNSDY